MRFNICIAYGLILLPIPSLDDPICDEPNSVNLIHHTIKSLCIQTSQEIFCKHFATNFRI